MDQPSDKQVELSILKSAEAPFPVATPPRDPAPPSPIGRLVSLGRALRAHAVPVLALVLHLGLGCLGAGGTTAHENPLLPAGTPSLEAPPADGPSLEASTTKAYEITSLSAMTALTATLDTAPGPVLALTGLLLPRVRPGSAAADGLAGRWLEAQRRLGKSDLRPPCYGTAVLYTLEGPGSSTDQIPWERAEYVVRAYTEYLTRTGVYLKGEPGLEAYGLRVTNALTASGGNQTPAMAKLSQTLLSVGACEGRLLVFSSTGKGPLRDLPVDLGLGGVNPAEDSSLKDGGKTRASSRGN